MDFFDLHCDTVSRLTEGGGIADADAHINLEKARTLGRWAQVFAVFVQDNAPGADTAYASYRRQTACFRAQLAANREQIVQCRTAQETKDAFEEGRRAAILSVENGAALGGHLERLAEFQRDGVRFLTLTWMGENELGCGGEAGGPLTEFGRAVVRALPQYGIVPDVSHLSDEGVADVFECYDGPVVATHSNVRRVTGHHRNLTEKQIQEIVQAAIQAPSWKNSQTTRYYALVTPEKVEEIHTAFVDGKRCLVIPMKEDEEAKINGETMSF